MGAADLVVALQAVQAVLLLAIQILDDQAIIDQVCVLCVCVCVGVWVRLGGGCLLWFREVGRGGKGGVRLAVAHSGAAALVQAVLLLAIQILDGQAIIHQVC
jgi:hypothetical protein